MSKYSFTPFQRYAVFLVHGEKCYLCSRPLDLKTMEVDHIIPETLQKSPKRLKSVLHEFGLPDDFAINSYQNWLPACRPCNDKKRDLVFNPAPIILVYLQNAVSKAEKAAELENQMINTRKISNALNTLERANELGELDDAKKSVLEQLVNFHTKHRTPETANTPIRLTPFTVFRVIDLLERISSGTMCILIPKSIEEVHTNFYEYLRYRLRYEPKCKARPLGTIVHYKIEVETGYRVVLKREDDNQTGFYLISEGDFLDEDEEKQQEKVGTIFDFLSDELGVRRDRIPYRLVADRYDDLNSTDESEEAHIFRK